MLKFGNCAVFNEVIGQSETLYLDIIVVILEPLSNGRTKSAVANTILYGYHLLEVLAYLLKNILVERLEETHIIVGDRGKMLGVGG